MGHVAGAEPEQHRLLRRRRQDVGTVAGTNLLVDSPPTHQQVHDATRCDARTRRRTDGWNFHNTYFVTIKAAKLARLGFNPATWSVEPNETVLHNSPAKPCPVSTTPQCNFAIEKYEVSDKEVRITIKNNGTIDEFLTALNLTWPQATNGNLTQIKLDGDVIYNGPAIGGGSANLTAAQLTADSNKRKIGKGSSDTLKLIFQNNAATNLAAGSGYSGTVNFGDTCQKTILPKP